MSLIRLIAALLNYIVSLNPRSSWLQQCPEKTNNSPFGLRTEALQTVQVFVCFSNVSLIPAARISRTSAV